MSLDRALQWTTAAVAVVGALFLALGHESGWLPMVLAIAAGFSVLVTDLVSWLRLNRMVGNLIAVAAVAWSLYDFLDRTSDQQLMAISQMLVILQVLLLFQEETGRTYWQLLVLSLLQVVVAAALNSGLEFGLLLTVYMVLSLVALVLLCVHRALVVPPEVRSAVTPARLLPWNKLLSPPEFRRTPRSPEQTQPPFSARTLTRQVFALAVATISLTMVFFYLTPRLNDSAWRSQRRGGTRTTGVSQEVNIEEFGRIHQSNQVVMRVVLSDWKDHSPYTMIGEPYFQGGVLTQYEREGAHSHWVWVQQRNPQVANQGMGLGRREPPPTAVRQDYMLELQGSPIAFAIFPARWAGLAPNGLRLDRAAGRILRADSDATPVLEELRYSCVTTALVHGRQLHGVPHLNPALTFDNAALLREELAMLREFDARQFRGLSRTAQSVLQSAAAPANDPLVQAQALERHFLNTKLYHYSLNLDFERDQRLDPIEDFVVNHRTGHCEYFASALVLMLRSQGIPARMVFGYKGGEYNLLGKYFIVRQKHAHAWVEAWMPPGAVPESEIAGPPSRGGCWYRLDPTPSSGEYLAGAGGLTFQDQLASAFDYVELLWRDYVVNLNSLRQHQAVIDPATANTFGALPDWIDSRSPERWFKQLAQRLGLPVPRRRVGSADRILDWRLASAVAGGLIVLVIVVQFGSVVFRWLPRWLGWVPGGDKPFHRPPAFYRRLERLLARMRLSRRAGQTASELAEAAESRLVAGRAGREVAELPEEIVRAYYRVRFGGDALDNTETAEIEHALAALVPAVSQAQQQ